MLLTDTFTVVVEVVATLTHGAGQRIGIILPQIDADGAVVEHIFAIYKINQWIDVITCCLYQYALILDLLFSEIPG